MPDKYTAVWVSHTSISDFLKCPRAYYLKNIYKDPATNHKIQIMSPALALGQAVHEVIESLSTVPTEQRFKTPLSTRLGQAWSKISGKRGGFTSLTQEETYKDRAKAMLEKVERHPGPLVNLAVKIKEDLPHYWLSAPDNIILCGKVDWLEYLQETDSVHIIDFKTSKREEEDSSLQLPIYHLLVANTQHRQVTKASYWYLQLHDELVNKDLPDLTAAHDQVLSIAKKMKVARQLNVFKCPAGEDGCFACRDFERILQGEGELVGENEYRQDVYIIDKPSDITTASDVL